MTLRGEVAEVGVILASSEALQRSSLDVTSSLNHRLPAFTHECLRGTWKACGSGNVSGPNPSRDCPAFSSHLKAEAVFLVPHVIRPLFRESADSQPCPHLFIRESCQGLNPEAGAGGPASAHGVRSGRGGGQWAGTRALLGTSS